MARCKHHLATKTDGNGNPSWTVCRRGCGLERAATAEDIARGWPDLDPASPQGGSTEGAASPPLRA